MTSTANFPAGDAEIVDLSDQELRARGTLKWSFPPAGVLPAWVAEIDVAPAPVITRAVAHAVTLGSFGYPSLDGGGVPQAFQEYSRKHWGWTPNSDWIHLAGDVLGGIRVALETLCALAPVIVPTPAYHPFLDAIGLSHRMLVPIPLDPNAPARFDLNLYADALRAGARTILLTQPHNPWGRVFTAAELGELLQLAGEFDARIISDEIHAPLVLPGATHVPLASLPGAAERVITVTSASKAWNIPALSCALIVTGNAADSAALKALPLAANHGLSRLGQVATVAAYTHGQPWLDSWIARLTEIRAQFNAGLEHSLPQVRMRPLEGTYLAWLDVRECRLTGREIADPAREILTRGQLLVSDGRTFGPGGAGHVRVNLGTSVERVDRILQALTRGLQDPR